MSRYVTILLQKLQIYDGSARNELIGRVKGRREAATAPEARRALDALTLPIMDSGGCAPDGAQPP